jgi:hypothetical protein
MHEICNPLQQLPRWRRFCGQPETNTDLCLLYVRVLLRVITRRISLNAATGDQDTVVGCWVPYANMDIECGIDSVYRCSSDCRMFSLLSLQ